MKILEKHKINDHFCLKMRFEIRTVSFHCTVVVIIVANIHIA